VNGDVNLKDVKYIIDNGVLYITGVRYEYIHIRNITNCIGVYDWNSKWENIYEITEEDLNKYDFPKEGVKRNFVKINRYFFFLLWLIPFKKVYDIVYDCNKLDPYIKIKKEEVFNYCLHPFKLQE
jgi:hypothetical protein